MTLLALINQLQEMATKYGDLPVYFEQGYGHLTPECGARVTRAKVHQEGPSMFETDRLTRKTPNHGGTCGAFVEPYQTEISKRPDHPVVVLGREGHHV